VLEDKQAVFVDDVRVRKLQCGDCGARWTHLPDGLTGHSKGARNPAPRLRAVGETRLFPAHLTAGVKLLGDRGAARAAC